MPNAHPNHASDVSSDDEDDSSLSMLARDPAFTGMVSTQFLGAFNDNFFKQMVLLKCTELSVTSSVDLQPLAMVAFALPFVLLSGTAGYLSDRVSKRSVVVWCKVAEIAVMAASLWVLILNDISDATQLRLLIVVLGLMATQSAIFGPSKYGILPELFKGRQLLPVNGAIQMTTFVAIIFGMAGAGIALDSFDNSLWICSLIAVGIAAIGTGTSLMVRRTPVAESGLKMKPSNLFIPGDMWALFRRQPRILKAALVLMVFWFIGGVAQPAVNNLGQHVLHISKTRTSLMAACMGVGIAAGCVVAGFLNKAESADGSRWTTRGGWMIVGSLLLIAFLGSGAAGLPTPSKDEVQGVFGSLLFADPVEWSLRLSMMLLGVSAGIFVVPVQVYIQEAPPAEQKGRMIGALNVITWIGILLSAAFLFVVDATMMAAWGKTEAPEHQYVVFLALAILMAPIALLYRLPTVGKST